jgi:gas vesicle protein
VGGVAAGLLLAPQSGRKLRGMIAERAKAQSRWAEQQLETLEERLSEVEERLRESAHHLAEQAREATHKATDQVFPDLPEDPQDWNIEGNDVAGELRRMPRR